jgi:hypothetical protein
MAKAKNAIPEFTLLNADMVSAVQSTTDGVIQQAESSSEIGALLHDAGYTSAMLDKTSNQKNEVLIAEIQTAIMHAPRFSAHDRELILNAEAGKTIKLNAEKAAIHVGRSYIRQTFAAIRKGIASAKLAEERGPVMPKTLAEKLLILLDSGIAKIQRTDGEKSGAPVAAFIQAFKDCRAAINAANKSGGIK